MRNLWLRNRFVLLLVHVLVAFLLVYGFHRYLPRLTEPVFAALTTGFVGATGPALDRIFRRVGGPDALLVAWFAVLAYLAGRRFLRWVGAKPAFSAESAALSLAAGISLASLLVLVLAASKVFYRPVAYGLLVVPTVVWRTELWQLLREIRRPAARAARVENSYLRLAHAFLGLYIVVVLVMVYFSAVGPSWEYDDLIYHLAGPKNFVNRYGLVPLPDVPFTFFPKNIEMLFTLAMAWHSDITAKLVHYLLGLTSLLTAYAFSTRFFSKTVGLLAAAVLASSPLFVWEMRTAHIDVALSVYVFAALYATILWLRGEGESWFRLAAWYAGFSLGIKYHALLTLAVLAIIVLAWRWYEGRAPLPALRRAGRLVFLAALGLIPWGLVNAYYTGNPVFPLLNNVFQSPYWTSEHTRLEVGEIFRGAEGVSGALKHLGLFGKTLTDPDKLVGGNIGPFYALLIPLLLFRRRFEPALKILLVFCVVYYVGWALSSPVTRFLLPALPCLAVAAACGLASWLNALPAVHRFAAPVAGALIALLAVVNTPFFGSYGASARWGADIMDTLPLRYILNLETRSQMLARYHEGYRAVQHLNSLPGPKKVFYVSSTADGFYLDGLAAFHHSPFGLRILGRSAESSHQLLRENHVTHLIASQLDQHTDPLRNLEGEFTTRFLRKLYQKNGTVLYELLPHGIEPEVMVYDFLGHLEEARIDMKDLVRPNGEYRYLFNVKDELRYSMKTQTPSEIEFQVGLGDEPVLTFAVAQANECAGRGLLQVWIAPAGGTRQMVFRRDLDTLARSEIGWLEHRVDLSRYAGQHVGVIFRTEDIVPPPCGSYLWADPQLTHKRRRVPAGEK